MSAPLTFTPLAGGRDAPVLLVVGPSLGTSVSALWAACAALVGRDVEVVGWDLPGHGAGAAATRPFTVDELADAVCAEAARRADGRPAAYAGVSLAGVVGFALSAAPGPFARVATVAAAPRMGEPADWHDRAARVRAGGTAVMTAPSSVRWFAPGFVDRQRAVGAALLQSLSDADRGSYAFACEALAAFDGSAAARAAVVPVLVTAGEHDPGPTPEQAAQVAATVPGAEYTVFAGCGHLPPAEDPATVAARLARFLSPRRTGGLP